MKIIGITGGVGSGKSTVSEILVKQYHAFLINTDQIAHMLMQKNMISYNLIVEYFGESILNQSKEIDRGLLGKIVYQNPLKLKQLNSFTHPYVMKYVADLIQIKKNEKTNLLCIETALPIEAGLKDFCDEVWYVSVPEDARKSRLLESRDYSEQKIDTIFKRQISEDEYRKISTHIINNNCSIERLMEQIEVLLEK
jgi:dephospho-CoA kinase